MNISYLLMVLVLMPECGNADLPVVLSKLSKYLRAPQPLPLYYNHTLEAKITLTKAMAQKGLSLHWVKKFSDSENFLLVLLQEHDIMFENIQINQQVYFLTPSLELFEKYIVNEQIIVQKLGHFVDELYVPNISADENVIKRRQNFHGYEMIAVTEEIKSALEIRNLENATYFPYNQTYDVTNSIQGSFFDIWKKLEKMLNFTTKIYKRKDKSWGVPRQLSNGTFELSDGMIKDVWSGNVDALISAATILHARYLIIDYLQPIMTRDGGFFVRKEALQEDFDLTVYWHPFGDWTWFLILSSSSIVTLCILFLWKFPNLTKENALKVLVRSLKVNLGTETDSLIPQKNQSISIKFLFFTTLLMGNVIWLTYNGALLSELITPKVVKPFHNLDTLIRSKYR